MVPVLLTALGVGGATLIGAIIGFIFKNISHKFSDIVLSFAAVVLIGLLEADNKNDIERENVSYEKETDMSCN